MKRLERLYAVSEEIRRRAPQTISAADLADRFGVTRRTMERDLSALRDAGVPLYAQTGRAGGHGIVGDGRTVFALSAQEVTALLIAIAGSTNAPYSDAAQTASLRLMDALPDATRVAVGELVERIRTADTQRPTGTKRVMRSLEEAVRQGRVVNVHYVDADDVETQRAVEAVGFYCGGDGWYLVGWCRLRSDRRLFRLDRVQKANLTREVFAARDVDSTLGWVPHPVSSP